MPPTESGRTRATINRIRKDKSNNQQKQDWIHHLQSIPGDDPSGFSGRLVGILEHSNGFISGGPST